MGKILAAGQSGAFFERLERILEKAAYKVCTAHDISSAADLLDKEILIDLIVLSDFAAADDNFLLLGKSARTLSSKRFRLSLSASAQSGKR